MSNYVILDTHILLWAVLEPEKLTEETKSYIGIAQEQNILAISSITLWEIAMLALKRRVNIYQPVKDFLNSITQITGLSVKDISANIAAESSLLTDDFHGDPADRLIVATAKTYGATLLTRDEKILSWADNGHIKCLKA